MHDQKEESGILSLRFQRVKHTSMYQILDSQREKDGFAFCSYLLESNAPICTLQS